jgi:hypothetical protein
MRFSVVGLPHYTIWHLYEPSVDDIKHMEVRSFFLFQNFLLLLSLHQHLLTRPAIGNGKRADRS